MEFKDALNNYLADNMLTITKFVDLMGWKESDISKVSRYLSGVNKPYPRTIEKIIDRLPDFEKYTKDLKLNNNGRNVEIRQVPFDDFMEVPYLSIEAQAGVLKGLKQDEPIDKSLLPTMLLPKEFDKGGYLVAEISGDSMNDGTDRSIRNGDKALVKEEFDYSNLPIRKHLFVIVSMEGIVFKQITKIDKENETLTCHSWNPAYEDYTIKFSEVFQIFVVKKIVERQINL